MTQLIITFHESNGGVSVRWAELSGKDYDSTPLEKRAMKEVNQTIANSLKDHHSSTVMPPCIVAFDECPNYPPDAEHCGADCRGSVCPAWAKCVEFHKAKGGAK